MTRLEIQQAEALRQIPQKLDQLTAAVVVLTEAVVANKNATRAAGEMHQNGLETLADVIKQLKPPEWSGGPR